jgi:hypothetical protein
MAQQNFLGQGLLNSEVSRSHSARHTTLSETHNAQLDFSGWMIRLMQRTLPDSAYHLKRDKHSSPGGIQTRNPSKRANADTRIIMRGLVIIIQLNILFIYLYAYLAA